MAFEATVLLRACRTEVDLLLLQSRELPALSLAPSCLQPCLVSSEHTSDRLESSDKLWAALGFFKQLQYSGGVRTCGGVNTYGSVRAQRSAGSMNYFGRSWARSLHQKELGIVGCPCCEHELTHTDAHVFNTSAQTCVSSLTDEP